MICPYFTADTPGWPDAEPRATARSRPCFIGAVAFFTGFTSTG
jgi:hypothetical protein